VFAELPQLAGLHAGTSLDNVPSIELARSVGYLEYARNWSIRPAEE
jgi:hypothetical protein